MLQITREWLENEAEQLLKKIMNRSLNGADLHGGAYAGAAGIAYAMLRASSSPFNRNREESLKYGRRVLTQHLEAVRKVHLSIFLKIQQPDMRLGMLRMCFRTKQEKSIVKHGYHAR